MVAAHFLKRVFYRCEHCAKIPHSINMLLKLWKLFSWEEIIIGDQTPRAKKTESFTFGFSSNFLIFRFFLLFSIFVFLTSAFTIFFLSSTLFCDLTFSIQLYQFNFRSAGSLTAYLLPKLVYHETLFVQLKILWKLDIEQIWRKT